MEIVGNSLFYVRILIRKTGMSLEDDKMFDILIISNGGSG